VDKTDLLRPPISKKWSQKLFRFGGHILIRLPL
jgi:hypothetical protein